jgi:hypothetical protein
LIKEKPFPRIVLHGDMSSASVRWQLAVAERLFIDNRDRAQDLREAAQDNREEELNAREKGIRRDM